MQINTTVKYQLRLVGIAIIKKKKKKEVTSIGKGAEKRKLLCTVGGSVNWYSYYGKQYGCLSKN